LAEAAAAAREEEAAREAAAEAARAEAERVEAEAAATEEAMRAALKAAEKEAAATATAAAIAAEAAEAARAREATVAQREADAVELVERREALERREVDRVLCDLVDELHEELEDRSGDLLVLMNVDEAAGRIAVNLLDPTFGIPEGGTFRPSSLQPTLALMRSRAEEFPESEARTPFELNEARKRQLLTNALRRVAGEEVEEEEEEEEAEEGQVCVEARLLHSTRAAQPDPTSPLTRHLPARWRAPQVKQDGDDGDVVMAEEEGEGDEEVEPYVSLLTAEQAADASVVPHAGGVEQEERGARMSKATRLATMYAHAHRASRGCLFTDSVRACGSLVRSLFPGEETDARQSQAEAEAELELEQLQVDMGLPRGEELDVVGSPCEDEPRKAWEAKAALTAKLAALNIYERVSAAQRQLEEEEAMAKRLAFATNNYVSGAVGSILDEIDLYGLTRL